MYVFDQARKEELIKKSIIRSGDFWTSPAEGVLYLRIFIDDNKLWLVQGDKINPGN